MQCGMVGTLFVALLMQCMLGLESAFMYFEMSPKYDQFILLGTLFQLNCTMKQYPVSAAVPEGYDVTKTTILKGSHELPTDVDIVFYQEDRTLAVTIPSVTLEHDGTYNCYYGNDSIMQSVKPVHVGEPPSKPESIVCVSNNLNDLKCSFTLSRKSTNIPIGWIMEYRLSDVPRNASAVNCSKSSDLVYSCEPCPVFKQFALYEILIKGVNVDFELQVNESFPVKLNQSIVRPNPVNTLRVAFTNVSSEIKLLWNFPKGLALPLFTLQYKIVITSDWDNRTLHKEGNEEHEEYLVTKLVPYANYWVTVEAKPVEAVGDIYWSSKSAMDFWTESDICEHTVSITTGSYMVMDCEHAMCAVLYWKNPARKDWNGNIKSYHVIGQTVKLAEYTGDMASDLEKRNVGDRLIYRIRRVTKGWSENVTGIAVSGVLKEKLTKTDNYSMRIMIVNSAGISRNYIEIVIPNMDKGETLKVEWVSVEMASSTVSVSWHMDPKNCDAVRSVTYYWGLADTNSSVMNEYTVYKDEIDWRTFDISDGCGNETSHQFEKFLYQSNTRYGISVGTGQISGGMVMESFRFNKQNDVADMPQYTVSADRDRLQVHILYTDYYVSEGGRPVQYQIVYSEDSGKDGCPLGGHINTFPTDFTNPVFEINNLNLKAGVQYKVCVAALNAAGIGRYGEPVITKTPEDDSAITMVLFIIVPCFAILFVVFAVFICKMCNRRFHRFKIDTQKINVPFPDMENAAQNTYLNKLSDDHDSGKGSDSPASSSTDINQLQQDGVRVSPKTSSCNVSTVSTEDDGPDRSRERRVSPALSGYLNVVTSSNSVGMLGCLDDENDSLINGEHISYERNGGKRRINNTIDGELSCSNCDEDLNITKATLGNVPRRNEHLPNNANNATGNAILPNGNEYLPNGNDQEIDRFIAGIPNMQQESPNSNPVYVDEHDARKVPTNVKAYVPNEAKMFPKRLHFYMEVDNAMSGVLNVNRRPSDSTEVELNDSQIDEKIGEYVETSFLNSQKLGQENSIGVMNSVQQSKDNLKAKARLPTRERKQEAIDSNNDALQSSHDYQTHPNCNVKANEDMISDYVEAETSNDMDTFEHDRDITSEETEEPAALCAVITDFEKNPSTEGNLEGRVNTEYNGSFVNMMRRSSQDSTSRYNDEDIFTFDNFIDSNIGHYKNPDEISLGQGSTISDCSDTTSIKSSESLFETPFPEVCKELQDFVEAEDVVDEGNGNKVEVKHNVKNDKKIKEEGKHAEVGDHIEKSRGKCSVHSGDSEHGESFSSESSKNTSDTGNVVSYMITGLESATDGIQEFSLQNTEITDGKARKGTSLNDASTGYAGNAFDSDSVDAIGNDIQITQL